MGFPCIIISEPKPIEDLVEYITFTLEHIMFIVLLVLSHLGLFSLSDNGEGHADHVPAGDLQTMSTLPVPVQNTSSEMVSMKERLPVVEFGQFIERSGGCEDVDGFLCVICLSCLERSHEIRELSNCSHVFHKECVDKWIDEKQSTCPLCRSKLVLPIHGEQISGGEDPWLVERFFNLYGHFGDNFGNDTPPLF